MASMRTNIRSYAAASAGKNDMSIVITAALRDQPDTHDPRRLGRHRVGHER
jgi:hypothetical protein